MRTFIEELCSERCSGRATGSQGGAAARQLIMDAFRRAGLAPTEQRVPQCGGTNVLAELSGSIDRWIVVAAHYDHLGQHGKSIFRGADDNAAAVAILIEVARAVKANRPKGRSVLFAAFDAEEPPHFLSDAMGSQHFVTHPTVPLDRIDLMVCMDLVGHAVGPEEAPDQVRNTVFALGAERSVGTGALVDRIALAEPGVVVRRADAEIIPPLSDYDAFWKAKVPFLFLTNGRWRHYHTPEDTPEKLDYPKITATARWLERLVREACARPEPVIRFLEGARDDASTMRSLIGLTGALEKVSPQAAQGRAMAQALLAQCDGRGQLPEAARSEAAMLISMLEAGLA
jgi:Zn-dependent M28 family amino/carboxypeptidase